MLESNSLGSVIQRTLHFSLAPLGAQGVLRWGLPHARVRCFSVLPRAGLDSIRGSHTFHVFFSNERAVRTAAHPIATPCIEIPMPPCPVGRAGPPQFGGRLDTRLLARRYATTSVRIRSGKKGTI